MVLAVEVYEIVGDCPVCEGKGERAFGKIPPVPCSKCGGLGKARKRINIPGVDLAALVAVIAEVGVERLLEALDDADDGLRQWRDGLLDNGTPDDIKDSISIEASADIHRRLAAALGGGK